MHKNNYSLLVLALGLSLTACSKDKSNAPILPPTPSPEVKPVNAPRQLTSKYWVAEGTSADGSSYERLRYDFRPDGTMRITYSREPRSGGRQLPAASSRIFFYFSGTYAYTTDRVRLTALALEGTEGTIPEALKTSISEGLFTALRGAVWTYNEGAGRLSFTPPNPAGNEGAVPPSTIPLILTYVAAPAQDKASASEPVTREELRTLTDGYWIIDEMEGNDYRHRIRFEFKSDGTYEMRLLDEHFAHRASSGSRQESDQEVFFRGTYEQRDGKVRLLTAAFDRMGALSEKPLTEEEKSKLIADVTGEELLVDLAHGRMAVADEASYDEEGRLQEKAGLVFIHTTKAFSLTATSWRALDGDQDRADAPAAAHSDKEIIVTFRPDGTYIIRFTRYTGGAYKEDMRPMYNNDYSHTGSYSYADGKVRILSCHFLGYGSRVDAARRANPDRESEQLDYTGLVFVVDAAREVMRISAEESKLKDKEYEPNLLPFLRIYNEDTEKL